MQQDAFFLILCVCLRARVRNYRDTIYVLCCVTIVLWLYTDLRHSARGRNEISGYIQDLKIFQANFQLAAMPACFDTSTHGIRGVSC